MFISTTVYSPVFHIKGHPDTFHNINTSEVNQRHHNKSRTNNAV